MIAPCSVALIQQAARSSLSKEGPVHCSSCAETPEVCGRGGLTDAVREKHLEWVTWGAEQYVRQRDETVTAMFHSIRQSLPRAMSGPWCSLIMPQR